MKLKKALVCSIIAVLLVVGVFAFNESGKKVTFGFGGDYMWEGKIDNGHISAEMPMKDVWRFFNLECKDREGNKYIFLQSAQKIRYYARFKVDCHDQVKKGDVVYQKMTIWLYNIKMTKLGAEQILPRISATSDVSEGMAEPIEKPEPFMEVQELRSYLQTNNLAAIVVSSRFHFSGYFFKVLNVNDGKYYILADWPVKVNLEDMTDESYAEENMKGKSALPGRNIIAAPTAVIFKASGTDQDAAIALRFDKSSLGKGYVEVPGYAGALTEIQGGSIEKLRLYDRSLPANKVLMYGPNLKMGDVIDLQWVNTYEPFQTQIKACVVKNNKNWDYTTPILAVATHCLYVGGSVLVKYRDRDRNRASASRARVIGTTDMHVVSNDPEADSQTLFILSLEL